MNVNMHNKVQTYNSAQFLGEKWKFSAAAAGLQNWIVVVYVYLKECSLLQLINCSDYHFAQHPREDIACE